MKILLIVFIGILTIIIGVLIIVSIRYKKRIADLNLELESSKEKISTLSQDNSNLSRFRNCVNADAKAAEILNDANNQAEATIGTAKKQADAVISNADDIVSRMIESAKCQGEEILRNANIEVDKINADVIAKQEEASQILKDANAKALAIEQESIKLQANASVRSTEIIANAKEEARKIAGDAYDLALKAEDYQDLIESMRNIINGYGNEYLKPTESVLDGLAEEFGFTEAGKELARVRAVRTQLSESMGAAVSKYVERNRHDTAVRFIIDAFNGKVESILSMVKENNIGTLERKIKDSYNLVNYLGSAFRDTRITPEYLNECLDELKWAVAVIALRNKARDEQRAIKERIREEERARREYERAIRDAEKQEAAIRKAIDKATIQLAKANEEQRIKYEAQLVELQSQLSEAEARNQRALSMAQQTRSGHVYIISNIGSFGENIYKIGMTRRLEPLDRVRELGDASVPFPFDVHAMIYSEDAPSLESELHKLYARHQLNKVNPRKEFFRLNLPELREYIDGKNMQVRWTMKAEAAQYRETLSLEKAFENNEYLESQWMQDQKREIAAMESVEDDETLNEP